jgi:hypothetical protein
MAQLVALLLLVAICVQFGPLLLRKLSGGKSVALAGALAIGLALIAFAQASHFEQALKPVAVAERAHSQRCSLAGFAGSRACVAGRRIIRVWARHVSRCISNIQSQWERSGAGDVEIFARGLSADPAGMGLDRRNLWALLFFGGITVGIRSYKEHARREWTPRRRVLQPLVIIALMGVALHALVDFPVQIESIQLYVATYLGLCWGSMLWKDHGLRTTEHADRSTSWHSAT